LRVARQAENALLLARRLEGHPKVVRVLYPGLASHPGHETARRQMKTFGGMLSFVVAGGLPAAERFYDGLQLVARAASLGGVESLVSLPVHTSHHGYTPEQLAAAGVDPGQVRVSLGVEDGEDIVADVENALEGA
jgi:cystathionine beta-lyase/cystathionine gamma-synthase